MLLPGFGANLIHFTYKDWSFLRTPEHLEALEKSPYLYGIPALFPPNRVKDGKFIFEGRDYVFNINEPERNNHIHGFLYHAPFELTGVKSSAAEAKAECTFMNHESTSFFKHYPHPFRFGITYTLKEKRLCQEIIIKNTGEAVMPVNLGFHTTFALPFNSSCSNNYRFRVPIGKLWEVDNRFLPTGKILELTEVQKEYATGCSLQGGKISGFYSSVMGPAVIWDDTICLQYEVSGGYTQWVLYNGTGDEGYLCIEPQLSPVNCFNMDTHITALAPDDQLHLSAAFSIVETLPKPDSPFYKNLHEISFKL